MAAVDEPWPGGDRAADDDAERHHQALLRRQRRQLAALRSLDSLPGPMMASAVVLMRAATAAPPPDWVSRARETGDRDLRARLYEWSAAVALSLALSVVGLLTLTLHEGPAANAERAMAIVGRFFLAIHVSLALQFCLANTGDLRGAAAAFLIVVAAALLILSVLSVLRTGRN